MSGALTIARVEALRMVRERANIFFVFLFPLLLVVLIGLAFGEGGGQRVGVVAPEGDEAASALLAAVDDTDAVTTVVVDEEAALRDRVARGGLAAGIVVPEGYGRALAAGDEATVGFVGRPDGSSRALRSVAEAAVAEQAQRVDAARAAAEALGVDAADLEPVAARLQGALPGVDVAVTEVGEDELAQEFAGLGRFDLGASSQLFLFTFLTALAGSAELIQARRLGISRRVLATPTSPGAVIAGHAAGRLLVALIQAAYIVIATLLLFQVDWGEPLATGAVVLAFCLVAGGAGMLLGATLHNDSQAGGAGVGLGLGMAALGGSMVPLEIFPPTVATVAHVTPHAWANEAMATIVRRDGGLADVLLEVGVLLGLAAACYALAGWRLRRVLTR